MKAINNVFLVVMLLHLAGQSAWPQAYKLVWSDEFNTDGQVDTTVWNFEHGFVRNHEAQWYQADNACCQNGLLVITAKKEQVPNTHYVEGSQDWRRNRPFADYTSASLNTRGKKAFQYGRFEIRAKIPTVREPGLPSGRWEINIQASCGEIDIMEFYRIGGVPHILANAAWGTDVPYKAHWKTVKIPLSRFTEKDPAWAERFHVWRMDWDETAIRIYLDDQLMNEIRLAETINGSIGNYTNPFQQPHYLLLNLAIGGDNGGTPDPQAFPLQYEMDYVRVFQQRTVSSK
jgi:beta-glucanase (GH16 family)